MFHQNNYAVSESLVTTMNLILLQLSVQQANVTWRDKKDLLHSGNISLQIIFNIILLHMLRHIYFTTHFFDSARKYRETNCIMMEGGSATFIVVLIPSLVAVNQFHVLRDA